MSRRAPGPPAASVVIPWGGGIVGITRGNDLADVCFPGGTGELADRSPRVTAIRELREETGIVVLAEDLDEVLVRADGGHVTYYATRVVSMPSVLASNPFEGHPAVYHPGAFVAPTSRYRDTAAETFRRLAARLRVQRNPLEGYEQLRRRMLR